MSARVNTLVGLLRLSEGDRSGAQARHASLGSERDARLLGAALAAVSSAQDLTQAARDLSGALAGRRVGRVEVRAWRAVARSRLPFRSPKAAEQTLEDLNAARRARGALLLGERIARVRALLGADRSNDARAEVAEWANAPPEVLWPLALNGFSARIKTGTLVALVKELESLPEESVPDPRRATIAASVRERLAKDYERFDQETLADEPRALKEMLGSRDERISRRAAKTLARWADYQAGNPKD